MQPQGVTIMRVVAKMRLKNLSSDTSEISLDRFLAMPYSPRTSLGQRLVRRILGTVFRVDVPNTGQNLVGAGEPNLHQEVA